MEQPEVKNILIVGRTGAGKSSLCKTIAGSSEELDFQIGHGAFSETSTCASKVIVHNNIHYRLIDTIGIMDTRMDANEVISRIVDALIEFQAKNLHLLVILFKFSEKLTLEQLVAMNSFPKFLDDENGNLKKNTLVIGTDFERNMNNQSLIEQEKSAIFQGIQPAGYKYLFENKDNIMFIDNPAISAGCSQIERDLVLEKIARTRQQFLSFLASKETLSPFKIPLFDELRQRAEKYVDEITKKKMETEELIKNLKEQSENSDKEIKKITDELESFKNQRKDDCFADYLPFFKSNMDSLAGIAQVVANRPQNQSSFELGLPGIGSIKTTNSNCLIQ